MENIIICKVDVFSRILRSHTPISRCPWSSITLILNTYTKKIFEKLIQYHIYIATKSAETVILSVSIIQKRSAPCYSSHNINMKELHEIFRSVCLCLPQTRDREEGVVLVFKEVVRVYHGVMAFIHWCLCERKKMILSTHLLHTWPTWTKNQTWCDQFLKEGLRILTLILATLKLGDGSTVI